MSNCMFCKIISKEISSYIIYEDDTFLAILDRNPINPGHILLLPKKHDDYIFDLDENTYLRLLSKARELAVLIKKGTDCKRVGMAVEGFGVPHIHIHLVPVNSGNELNPERAKSTSDEELKSIKEKIYHIKEVI
jgi:histidine triad (HIT) family protein